MGVAALVSESEMNQLVDFSLQMQKVFLAKTLRCSFVHYLFFSLLKLRVYRRSRNFMEMLSPGNLSKTKKLPFQRSFHGFFHKSCSFSHGSFQQNIVSYMFSKIFSHRCFTKCFWRSWMHFLIPQHTPQERIAHQRKAHCYAKSCHCWRRGK